MNAERLLAHYERIADAPDAIHSLRRFVLELAVRGKLVEQDVNDEPASELLKQIVAEKARLVRAGKIRKPRDLGGNDDVPTPFEIPSCWRWVRLDGVGAIIGGGTPSANDAENFADSGTGVPWLTPADLGSFSEWFISRGARDLSETGLKTSSATLMPAGTVLFTSRAPIGYVAISANPISTNQGFKSIVPYIRDCSRFIALAMKAFAPEIDANAPGTTFKEVSGKNVAGVPFPLPPLAEQHRIVAKVDELMALCDQLEAARTERETTRNRLAAASLARLNAPDPDPARFQNHVGFALGNLTPLTTRPDQIKSLRQTILNLAIRGKLVAQDPDDEPASELLRKIAAETARLVRMKKIKARKETKPAISSDVDFTMPAGWSPVKIEQILIEMQTGPFGSSLHQSDYQLGGVPVINPASIQNERIVPIAKMAVGPTTLARLASFQLRTDDIIMGRRGEMGRCAVITERERGWLCGTGSLMLRASKFIYPRFLSMLIGSPFSRQYLSGTAVGTTMQNLNQTILLNLALGLPPLAEQHCIVAKVDELMALCDRLEESLATGGYTCRRLLDAVVHDALAPNADPKAATRQHA